MGMTDFLSVSCCGSGNLSYSSNIMSLTIYGSTVVIVTLFPYLPFVFSEMEIFFKNFEVLDGLISVIICARPTPCSI